jgi:hypothetical protein
MPDRTGETPLSMFRKATYIVSGAFIFGMAVLFYFIATGDRMWSVFWWATVFSGVIIAASTCNAAIRSVVNGTPLSFEGMIAGPAAFMLLTWVFAYIAASFFF